MRPTNGSGGVGARYTTSSPNHATDDRVNANGSSSANSVARRATTVPSSARGSTNGYSTVTCAGTPCTADGSSRSRHGDTTGVAVGTGTTSPLSAPPVRIGGMYVTGARPRDRRKVHATEARGGPDGGRHTRGARDGRLREGRAHRPHRVERPGASERADVDDGVGRRTMPRRRGARLRREGRRAEGERTRLLRRPRGHGPGRPRVPGVRTRGGSGPPVAGTGRLVPVAGPASVGVPEADRLGRARVRDRRRHLFRAAARHRDRLRRRVLPDAAR